MQARLWGARDIDDEHLQENEMNLIEEITSNHAELTEWRRDIHAHPELAFDESRTAALVAERLESFGIEVTRGVGGTGVVGTLRSGTSERSVGLRADMDALPMEELNDFRHKSKYPGKMHGCGHDGHTVMLLGAARYLAEKRQFDGTVQFVFQPAEEANDNGSGAKAMIADGLFDHFPIDKIFGMHNYKLPGLKTGGVAVWPGPVAASMDLFEVRVTGHGCHGALPHMGADPVLICAHLVSAWQTIVSRNVNPLQSAVISATTIQAGDSWNVIPETALIRGSIRALSPGVRELVEDRFRRITEDVCSAFGATAVIDFRHETLPVVNTEDEAALVCEVARELVGEDYLLDDFLPTMGSEDFAWYLEHCPGAYLFIGNGAGPAACAVHEAKYDFNDDILPIGASLWARLAEKALAI